MKNSFHKPHVPESLIQEIVILIFINNSIRGGNSLVTWPVAECK